MTLMERLFGPARREREDARPLWQAVIAAARRPRWFAELGVEDSVAGRFDMVSAVLALVLLRLESDPAMRGPSALLTEWFIEDMDAQLRQSGVGDLVVGKHIGKLMAVLGGRMGALRAALAEPDDAALTEVVARNTTLADPARAPALAGDLRGFAQGLAALSPAQVLAGALP